MNTKKTFIVLITFLFLSFAHQNCFAQVKKDTLKVLFVGNSYTYFENLPQIASIISSNTKTKILTQKSTLGGASLRRHWQDDKNLKTKEMIKNGNYDIVVLQGHSMSTINELDSISKYAKLFSDLIRKNNAKPYLYLTWARERVPQYQEIINKGYGRVAAENNATIVPVGKAWDLARKLRPNINLFNPDGTHPSKLGTFLTACTFVATISGELPNKLPRFYQTIDTYGETINLMSLDPLDVVFCRKIIEEIVLN